MAPAGAIRVNFKIENVASRLVCKFIFRSNAPLVRVRARGFPHDTRTQIDQLNTHVQTDPTIVSAWKTS